MSAPRFVELIARKFWNKTVNFTIVNFKNSAVADIK